MATNAALSDDMLTYQRSDTEIAVGLGKIIQVQTSKYRKIYEEKPFPNAIITYFSNGLYKITSEGEDHYGVYVMQGGFQDETYTIRFISLPSRDWGQKTAFHQLTFINGTSENWFIQNAITDEGEAIAQQNGTFKPLVIED